MNGKTAQQMQWDDSQYQFYEKCQQAALRELKYKIFVYLLVLHCLCNF